MKKLLVVVLMLTMLLFAACAKEEAPAEQTPAEQAPAEQTPAEPAVEEIAYPEKSVEIVVPFSAGGDSDFNGRMIAQYLSESMGESFVVVNINGAGGALGCEEVMNSPADGYKLLSYHANMFTNEAFGNTEYGLDDFEVICIFGQPVGDNIIVRADFPADNMEEFMAEVSANPDKYKYGINVGGTAHFGGVQFENLGAKMNFIPVGGVAERIAGLAGGHLDVIISHPATVADYLTTGEFKTLGIASTERHSSYPDTPTLIEQGVDVVIGNYYALYAPKGTDPAILDKLSAAVGEIVNNNADYQSDILDGYDQVPFFAGREDAYEILSALRADYMELSDQLKESLGAVQ